MSGPSAEELADQCTSLGSLHNLLTWHLKRHGGETSAWVSLAERAITLAVQGELDKHLTHPDGNSLTVAETIETMGLTAFVNSEPVSAVIFGATVLQLPMCVMCSATARYNAQIWTTKENCDLCQRHFTEYGVKKIPPGSSAAKQPSIPIPVVNSSAPAEGGPGSGQDKGDKSMLGETPTTILTYRDYATALYQRTIRYFDQAIHPDYLRIRIKLLGQVFLADDSSSSPDLQRNNHVRDDSFLSGNSIKPIDLFGIEGHLEGFEALSTAWNRMRELHADEIEEVEQKIRELRRDWIMLYLEAHLSDEAKQRTVTVQTLIDRGLPEQPPPFDPFDDF